IVIVVLPWAADAQNDASPPKLSASEVPVSPAQAAVASVESVPTLSQNPQVRQTPVPDAAAVRANALLAASDQERRELARFIRRRDAQSTTPKFEHLELSEKKSRFPVPQELPPGEATLAYWNKMNQIIAEEEQIRAVPFGGLQEVNMQNFLKRRVHSGKFAAIELERLGTEHVDPEVIELSKAFIDRYSQGANIAQLGEILYLQGIEDNRHGEHDKLWRTSEREQSRAIEELDKKSAELQKILSEKYQLKFPPIK
ncbi:MAG: hypothetical protein O2955_15890, partial [Planctomycetota bacterium]|nr:hypothetical protein [Planctomycetota bacterium]